MGKVVDLDELAECLHHFRMDAKVVLCHGCFDILTYAHVRHLQAAKDLGDVLVVTVTPDEYVLKGQGRPVFQAAIRAEVLAALECVDFVALNRWPTAAETIRLLRPDVYCKGREERKDEADIALQLELLALEGVGGRLVLTDGEQCHSSDLVEVVK